MDDRIPPLVGAVGALSVILAVVAPYLLLPASEAPGLSTYYGYGFVSPLGIAALSVFVAIAFLGGAGGRTDPGLVAGVTLPLGAAVDLLVLQWAVAVDPEVVQSIGTGTWLSSHRWVVAGLALSLPVAAAWYARSEGYL